MLRKLETVEKAFWQNAKIVVPADGQLVNVIGDLAGVAPLPKTQPATAPASKQQRRRPAGRVEGRAGQLRLRRAFFSSGGRLAAYASSRAPAPAALPRRGA